MKRAAIAILILLPMWLLVRAATAESRLGASCDLSVLGVHDGANFYRFDSSLREAVTSRNGAALAALVQFPVRLNYRHGRHIEVKDAAALGDRYTNSLWPILQKAVIGQQPGQLFCNADGVMYGDGAVWANPNRQGQRFHITAFNLPGDAPAQVSSGLPGSTQPASAGNAQLSCGTNKFHIVIDTAADHRPRYRAWNLPLLPPSRPAMELAGVVHSEGTGVCSHRIWRFQNGDADYIVSEPGCNSGNVPSNAKARLEVEIHGKPELESWCH